MTVNNEAQFLDHGLHMHGRQSTTVKSLQKQEIIADEGNETINKIEHYANIGEEHFASSEYDIAIRYYRRSLLWARRGKDACFRTLNGKLCLNQSNDSTSTHENEIPKTYQSHTNLSKINNYIPQILNNIGRCQLARGEFQNALESHKEALCLYRTACLPDNHPDISVTLQRISDVTNTESLFQHCNGLNNVGRTHDRNGRYDKAMELYIDALETLRAGIGPVYSLIATQLNKIGICHWKMGQYEPAMISLTEALRVSRMSLGKNNPESGDILHNIGLVHSSKGEHGDAMSFYQQSFSIRKEVLGFDHPDSARTLIRIGMIHDETGCHDKAMKLFKEGLGIQKEALGNVHVDVAATLNNIGVGYEKIGKFEDALSNFTEALHIYKKQVGEEHVDVAVTLNNIGEVHRYLGNNEKAMSTFKKSLKIMTAALGEKHRNVATILHNIALVHSISGSFNEALDLYRRALAIQRSTLGDRHLDIAVTLNNMGEVYEKRGDQERCSDSERIVKYQKATKLYKKALRIRRAALGDQHIFVALTLNKMGKFHREKESDHSEALRRFNEALNIFRANNLSDDHPSVKETLSNVIQLNNVLSNIDLNANSIICDKKSDHCSSLNKSYITV